MPKPSGTASLRCHNCYNVFSIDASDIDIEEVGAEEREMGLEVFYEGHAGFNCPSCGNTVHISYEASEYPVGAFNDSVIHVGGGDMFRRFKDVDFSSSEQIYELSETGIYVPEERKVIVSLQEGVSELLAEISNNPKRLYQISPREFEELIAYVFKRHGFSVQLTKKTRDGGRDIVALKSELGIPSKYIIECKRYAMSNPVGVELVRSLYGVQMQEGANKAVLATTSRFTVDAKEFVSAKENTRWAMDLKDYESVVDWIRSTNRS